MIMMIDDYDDDDDGDDNSLPMVGDLYVVACRNRKTSGLKLIAIYIADSELGQILMTFWPIL